MKSWMTPTNGIAIVILIAGLLRLMYGGDENGRFGETTLLYFLSAAAAFLVTRLKTFKFGDLEFELQQLKEEVKEAKLVANIAQDSAKLESQMASPHQAPPQSESIGVGTMPDDPWKGVFGGRSIDKNFGRALTAEVRKLPSLRGWYSVTLSVGETPNATPLTGTVQFFLHDSFPNDRPVVRVANNSATLHLKAWGAFTVGALTDNGQCKLELDLAEIESAPMEFRSR